uniref:SGNH domain-containing protein n=1 Tax=Tanacetum cinerariifolium TaxID=118510 RepID=A0A699GJ12_TANCI|nr:hypothetical protein [Tanacetum cinerariifolium]
MVGAAGCRQAASRFSLRHAPRFPHSAACCHAADGRAHQATRHAAAARTEHQAPAAGGRIHPRIRTAPVHAALDRLHDRRRRPARDGAQARHHHRNRQRHPHQAAVDPGQAQGAARTARRAPAKAARGMDRRRATAVPGRRHHAAPAGGRTPPQQLQPAHAGADHGAAAGRHRDRAQGARQTVVPAAGTRAVRAAPRPVCGPAGRAVSLVRPVVGRHALGFLHGRPQDPPELETGALLAAADRLRGGARTGAHAGDEPQRRLLGHRGPDLSRIRRRPQPAAQARPGVAGPVLTGDGATVRLQRRTVAAPAGHGAHRAQAQHQHGVCPRFRHRRDGIADGQRAAGIPERVRAFQVIHVLSKLEAQDAARPQAEAVVVHAVRRVERAEVHAARIVLGPGMVIAVGIVDRAGQERQRIEPGAVADFHQRVGQQAARQRRQRDIPGKGIDAGVGAEVEFQDGVAGVIEVSRAFDAADVDCNRAVLGVGGAAPCRRGQHCRQHHFPCKVQILHCRPFKCVPAYVLDASMNPGDDAPPGTPGTGEDVCPVCHGSGQVQQDGEKGRVTRENAGHDPKFSEAMTQHNSAAPSDQHLKYRADIDGLRAIAVLAVVGFHAFPQYIRGGFIGHCRILSAPRQADFPGAAAGADFMHGLRLCGRQAAAAFMEPGGRGAVLHLLATDPGDRLEKEMESVDHRDFARAAVVRRQRGLSAHRPHRGVLFAAVALLGADDGQLARLYRVVSAAVAAAIPGCTLGCRLPVAGRWLITDQQAKRIPRLVGAVAHGAPPARHIKLVAIVLSIVLAWLTYRLIERPVRNNTVMIARHSSVVFPLVMLVVGSAGYYCYAKDGLEGTGYRLAGKSMFADNFENSYPDWHYVRSHDLLNQYREDCNFYDIPKFLPGGNTLVPRPALTASCYMRDKAHAKSVFIWGDSHAEHLNYGLKNHLPREWQILQVASSGCIPDANVVAPSTTDYCAQSNWFAMQSIRQAAPDVVLIAQSTGQSIDQFRALHAKLTAAGVKKVIFAGPVPHWEQALPKIVLRKLWENTPQRTFVGLDQAVYDNNSDLRAQFEASPSMVFADLIGQFCNAQGCLVYLALQQRRQQGQCAGRGAAMLVGKRQRAGAHGGAGGVVTEQARCLRHQRAGIGHAQGAAAGNRILGHQLEIEGVRADHHGLAQRRRLDQVLAAQRQQAAAHESDVAGRVICEHLAHRVAQQHVGRGIDAGGRGSRLRAAQRQRAAALHGQPCRRHQLLHFGKPLRVARHEQQQRPGRQTGARLAVRVQDQGFLPFPGAGAQQHRPRPNRAAAGVDGLAQRRARGQRGRWHHHVELDAAGHFHARRAQRAHAGGIGLGLRSDQRHAVRRFADQRAKALGLAQRALRQAGVGQHHGHAAPAARGDQVGPDLGFHQDAHRRLEVRDKARHHQAGVIRQERLHQARAMFGEQPHRPAARRRGFRPRRRRAPTAPALPAWTTRPGRTGPGVRPSAGGSPVPCGRAATAAPAPAATPATTGGNRRYACSALNGTGAQQAAGGGQHLGHRWRHAGVAQVDDARRPVTLRLPARRVGIDFHGGPHESSGNMGQTRIDADRQVGAARQRDGIRHRQLGQQACVGQAGRQVFGLRFFLGRTPGQQDGHGSERAAEGDPVFGIPFFGVARGAVEKYRVGRRHPVGARRLGSGWRQAEIGRRVHRIAQRRAGHEAPARHRVGARIGGYAHVVEDARNAFVARALAAVGHAHLAPAFDHAGGAHDDAGLEQALGVEHIVVLLGAQGAEELPDLGPGFRLAQALAPAPQRERDDGAHARVQAHQADKALLHHPVDMGVGEVAGDVGHHRQVVQHVAQRGDAHQQDIERPGAARWGCHRSERQFGVRFGGQDHVAELALDACQRGRCFRFEAHHDHRRGVGRTRQAEAILVFHAQAVDGDDLPVAGEFGVGAQLIHDEEVFAFGQVQVQLGRAVRLRQRIEQRRRVLFPGEDFQHARARVQAVVKAIPAVLEEDMAAHLAAQRGAGFLELGLDQRVAGLVHQRHAARLLDVRRQVARAFDVVQDLLARVARQDIGREQHHLAVRINDLAILGHQAQAVAVAVEGQADLGVGFLQAADQVLQVFRMGRIGVVIGERAVHFAEQLDHFAAHAAIQVAGKRASHAVAAIDGDLDRTRQLDVANDAFQVLGADVMGAVVARHGSRRTVVVDDALVQRRDRLTMDGLACEHHLEAVVVRWIVATGYHDARGRAQHVGAEIHHRRGHHAQVDHVHARRLQALRQRRRQRRSRQPTVAADHHALFAFGKRRLAERLADLTGHALVEGVIDDAANVVGFEDRLG